MSTLNGDKAPSRDDVPIRSILDTDLYKLTMQQAVLRHYPDTHVAYKFTNRSAGMKFTRSAVDQIQSHIQGLAALQLTSEEYGWLQSHCPYLRPEYLDFLLQFRFQPASQVKATFVPDSDDGQSGSLDLRVQGKWSDVIFYEVPVMAIISEVYFNVVDTQWTMQGQYTQAFDKAVRLTGNGIRYSEFGTRRRRSYDTHKTVIEGLVAGEAHAIASKQNTGKLLGTSNVHFAQLYDLIPSGTVAHEWTMAVAALSGYEQVNLKALQKWDAVYSPPDFVPNSPTHDLTIALTDTFSTDVFWNDLLSDDRGVEIAKRWRGLRQDSGDSKEFARKARQIYTQMGVDPKTKVVIYSDSLNVDRCIDLAQYSKEVGIGAGFGIGTFLTNDFVKASPNDTSAVADVKAKPPAGGAGVSKALNIVIKLDQVEGVPVVKISDDLTKNTGDPAQVAAVKRRFGIETADHVEDA